jgi:hypothetical protein
VEEQERTISFFESQHRSWLAIKGGSARYETKIWSIRDGKFVVGPNRSQTGTLEFSVTPLNNPTGLQSPAKIQARLFNDKYKLNFLMNNVFDSEASSWLWADDPNLLTSEEMLELKEWTFKTELFFFPLDFMAKTYSDELWNNRYMMSKEQFFASRGLPIRLSTPEETNQIFGGEPEYLFLASPAVVDAHYWFSAEDGELRQIDIFLPEGLVKSFRYEDYVQEKGGNAKYPRRFILTKKKGTGDQANGWEYIVELSGVELNIDIPAERFVPPQNGLLKQ